MLTEVPTHLQVQLQPTKIALAKKIDIPMRKLGIHEMGGAGD